MACSIVAQKLKTKVAPIICYESIYGAFVTEYVRKGANFLGVITNDAWWGDTQGHKQLLSYARLRAIENRTITIDIILVHYQLQQIHHQHRLKQNRR